MESERPNSEYCVFYYPILKTMKKSSLHQCTYRQTNMCAMNNTYGQFHMCDENHCTRGILLSHLCRRKAGAWGDKEVRQAKHKKKISEKQHCMIH